MPSLPDSALLREAAQWRLIGLLFEPPGDGWLDEVAALAEVAGDERLRQAAASARGEASLGLYHTTFGPGGPAAPRAVAYNAWTLPGALLSELEGYYEAFGYEPRCVEPPDHVSVGAGFVGFLRLKEAYARSRGADAQAAVAAEAAERFVSTHLAPLAEPLQRGLERSGIEYLALAAAALFERTGPAATVGAASPLLPLLDDDAQRD